MIGTRVLRDPCVWLGGGGCDVTRCVSSPCGGWPMLLLRRASGVDDHGYDEIPAFVMVDADDCETYRFRPLFEALSWP